jgi:hypothetical protein
MFVKVGIFIIICMEISIASSQCTNFYRVFASDSCDSIANAYRTTIVNLQILNPSLNCSNLPYNQLICVPNTAQLTCTNFYVANAGDTCASIASLYGTTIASLLVLNSNNLNCAATLQSGTVVCVASNLLTTTTTTTSSSSLSLSCNNYYRVYASDSVTLLNY